MLGHSAGIALPYDPDRARELLDEAGYPGGRGFPTVTLLTDRKRRPYSEYLQVAWRVNLGVEIGREAMEWGEFLDRLGREPPHIFCVSEPANFPDPDDLLGAPFFQPFCRWRNETYDRLVEEARRVTDQAERMAMYQQADKLLVEEAVVMPYAYGRCHLLVKPWIKRWPASMTKFWFWKDVIIEPH
jgi:oligopeptide transport system substrate-binding protein